MTDASPQIVFVPLYGRTLLQRRAPWFLALALAISFFLVVLRPTDWWLWPVFLVRALWGFLALRRPRRIRFGTWIVVERTPFPPWVFSRSDADRILSRLPP